MRLPAGRVCSIVIAALVLAGPAAAQERPQPPDDVKQREKITTPPEQSGWIQRQVRSFRTRSGKRTGFFVAFGGIKSGAGISLGPGVRLVSPNGAMFESKAVYSVRNFKLAQVAFTSRPLLSSRLTLGTRVRWQDAPALHAFGLGNGSTATFGDYSERRSEVSVNASVVTSGWLRLDGSVGFERFDTGPGHSRKPPLESVFPRLPGLDAKPDFVHGMLGAAIDTRESDSYSRSGSLLSVALHEYHQQNDGSFSFERVDLDGERYVPFKRLQSVVYFGASASFTSPRPGSSVPFFLMPTLGGGDMLRAYDNYRFRDRQSVMFTAEYRWLALEALDVALFYDGGTVAPRRANLDLRRSHGDAGIGVRLHGAKATVLRVELARGDEGLSFIFVLGG